MLLPGFSINIIVIIINNIIVIIRYFFDCLCPACLGEEVLGPFPRLAEVALQENCVAVALEEGLVGEVERQVLTSLLCEECGGVVASKVMMVMMLMMVMMVMVVVVVV